MFDLITTLLVEKKKAKDASDFVTMLISFSVSLLIFSLIL